MLETSHLIKSFQYFYQQLYQEPTYRCTETKTTIKQSTQFLEALAKRVPLDSINSHFVLRYLNFQYNYWQPKSSFMVYHKKIEYSLVIGVTSLERYFNRDVAFDYLLEDTTNFKKSVIQTWFIIKTNTKRFDNPIRARVVNTDGGLAQCLQFTTLYDSRDISCIKCFEKDTCKKLLLTNFPKIYRQRYGIIK